MNSIIKFFRKETPEEALGKYRISGKQIEVPKKIQETIGLLEKESIKENCLFRDEKCIICDKSPAMMIMWKGFAFIDEPLNLSIYRGQLIYVCSIECLYKRLVEFNQIPMSPWERSKRKAKLFVSHLHFIFFRRPYGRLKRKLKLFYLRNR